MSHLRILLDVFAFLKGFAELSRYRSKHPRFSEEKVPILIRGINESHHSVKEKTSNILYTATQSSLPMKIFLKKPLKNLLSLPIFQTQPQPSIFTNI